MREIRLKFTKEDNAKYIGHLDINRVMSRAFKRSGIPLWYTEGYNPRAYMSFSLPLSLGVESLTESVDIRLVGEISNEEIKSKMNLALPKCIRIADVYDDFEDCKEIAYSDYEFIIEYNDNDIALEKIKEVLNSEKIISLKKAKSHGKRIMKETDIKPFIISYKIERTDNAVKIIFRLCAGTQKNLSPTLLFDAIVRLSELDYEWRSIKRLNLLKEDMTEFK